jgi:hypothetical protein
MKPTILIISFLFFSILNNAQTPFGWVIDEINPGHDLTILSDETRFTEGSRSCLLQLNSGAAPYLISDVFYVTPGAEYEFSMDLLDYDTAGQIRIYADFYDTYGFDIFGQPPVFSSDSSDWVTVAWEGVVPDMAVVGYVRIKFYCQPELYNFIHTAKIWIDNFQFRINGDTNLILNGGFENWNVGVGEGDIRDNHLFLYPNPADNYVMIDLPAKEGFVIISDLTGRVVLRRITDGQSRIRIVLNEIPQGIYFVSMIRDDGFEWRSKLLII